MALATISVNVLPDEHLKISSVKKSNWLFPFTPIGKKAMNKPDTLDALDMICNFNKGELFLLKEIKDGMQRNHAVVLKKSNYALTDARKITKAINSFIKLGILKRVKREYYLVNPYFLVPNKDDQLMIKMTWDTTQPPVKKLKVIP